MYVFIRISVRFRWIILVVLNVSESISFKRRSVLLKDPYYPTALYKKYYDTVSDMRRKTEVARLALKK